MLIICLYCVYIQVYIGSCIVKLGDLGQSECSLGQNCFLWLLTSASVIFVELCGHLIEGPCMPYPCIHTTRPFRHRSSFIISVIAAHRPKLPIVHTLYINGYKIIMLNCVARAGYLAVCFFFLTLLCHGCRYTYVYFCPFILQVKWQSCTMYNRVRTCMYMYMYNAFCTQSNIEWRT